MQEKYILISRKWNRRAGWPAYCSSKYNRPGSTFFEGQAGVQFVHRYLAYVVAAMVLFVWVKGRKLAVSRAHRIGLHFVLALVIVQFLLGVCTLVMQVPVALGVAHQLGAFILFLSVVFLLHRFRNRSTAVFV